MSEKENPAVEPDELVDEVVERLMDRADASGTALLGEGGLLTEVTRAVLERALEAEMTGHLGYEKHDPAGRGSGPALGDILRYQARSGPLREFLERQITMGEGPSVVIGHSLGGVALVDLLAMAAIRQAPVRGLRLTVPSVVFAAHTDPAPQASPSGLCPTGTGVEAPPSTMPTVLPSSRTVSGKPESDCRPTVSPAASASAATAARTARR